MGNLKNQAGGKRGERKYALSTGGGPRETKKREGRFRQEGKKGRTTSSYLIRGVNKKKQGMKER